MLEFHDHVFELPSDGALTQCLPVSTDDTGWGRSGGATARVLGAELAGAVPSGLHDTAAVRGRAAAALASTVRSTRRAGPAVRRIGAAVGARGRAGPVAPAHCTAPSRLPVVLAAKEPCGCSALVAAPGSARPARVPDSVRSLCGRMRAPMPPPLPQTAPCCIGRSVRPSDLLAWADASAARGAGYATHGDWRAAFRSYIVAAELLAQLLADVEPNQDLRDRARRRMDVVVGIGEEIRKQHPRLLLLQPSQSTPEVVVANAWAELGENAADARSTLAREENRAGNAQLKAGHNAEAVTRYTASLELDGTRAYVYGNRSVAFLRMDDLPAAVRDARAAVDLEPEAAARRAGVPLRRGVDGINARRPAITGETSANEESGGDTIESSMADARRRFSQEVAQEVAMLRACSIDTATVQLIECAELGDGEGLLRALGEGAKIDWGNPGWLDYTALHMASLHGHIEIARLLLTAGANVSVIVRSFSNLASQPRRTDRFCSVSSACACRSFAYSRAGSGWIAASASRGVTSDGGAPGRTAVC